MKIFSTNTCPVPNDLESVIHHKDEVPAELGGMSEQQVQKSGKVLSHSIKPETIRSLLLLTSTGENFIKSKHWLCSRKLAGWSAKGCPHRNAGYSRLSIFSIQNDYCHVNSSFR